MFLVDNLFLLPFKGISFIARQVKKMAEDEYFDETGVRQRIRELYLLLETEKITEEEFAVREEELIERLERIQKYTKNADV